MEQAITQEFKENEIFPKTDNIEDWLKLLDYEPDNVVSLKPINAKTIKERPNSRKGII